MDNKSNQIGLINVVIGVAVMFLVLMQRNISSPQELLYWIATGMFLYHWYWGLVYFIKYLGATESFLELFFDFVIVGVLVSTMFWIDTPAVWFLMNGIVFIFAIIKYVLALKLRKLPERETAYVKRKISLEVPAVVLFLLGAIIGSFFDLGLLLGILVVVGHTLAIAFFIKTNVYFLHKT